MRARLRAQLVLTSLLATSGCVLGACLEDATVGIERVALVGDDGGAMRDAALSPDSGSRRDGGPGATPDAGQVHDAGGPPVDAGPCTPSDCTDVTVNIATVERAEALCPTGEAELCERNAIGVCELRCPEVPPEVSCGGVSLVADGACMDPTVFCRLELGSCAIALGGACSQRPTACTKELEPVCGCDGVTYDNRCLAFAVGINLQAFGACP